MIKTSLLNAFPIKAKHKSFGEIEVFGVKTQSAKSKYLMYYTQINGDWVWVYDYETELFLNDNTKDYDKKLLMDYGVKIQEYLLNPPFNLGHSQHGIACDKLANVRENFLNDRHAF